VLDHARDQLARARSSVFCGADVATKSTIIAIARLASGVGMSG